MPTVTLNVRTWRFEPFPTSARLVVRFVPSTAGHGNGALLPLREESVEPDADGFAAVELAQTTSVTPDAWFTIRFEWFSADGQLSGWSELPGKLRVPSAGGDAAQLLDLPPAPGSVLHGYGPPPSSLSGVLYIDTSGENPILYAPKGALI